MLNRKFSTILTLLITTLIFSICNAQSTKTPTETVQFFYSTLFSEDTATQHDTLKIIKPYLSKDLLNKYILLQSNPAMSGCVDYDLFTGAQDAPEQFKIADEKIIKDKADVKLEFIYSKQPTIRIVSLVLDKNNWRIDNIFYPELHTSMRAELARCLGK